MVIGSNNYGLAYLKLKDKKNDINANAFYITIYPISITLEKHNDVKCYVINLRIFEKISLSINLNIK
jgi:hypothetical protein|tara:strand:+ start:176 stop:376 length:201 start_codon:yes stop_codon:yes gene_type:complete